MRITPDLFEAFLKCATKCWLRATGEAPSGNAYAEWVKEQNERYRAAGADRLLAQTPPAESALSPPAEHLKAAKWRIAFDVAVAVDLPCSSRGNEAQTENAECGVQNAELSRRPVTSDPKISDSALRTPNSALETGLVTSAATDQGCAPPTGSTTETRLHALERVPSEGRGKAARFIPIRLIFRNKLTKDDKLLVAFDAFVLSKMLGREVSVAKIIHGDDHSTLKAKTTALAGEVRKCLEKIAALLSGPAPPDLILNRHCAECEFQGRCRQKALEKDDLSLLAGMSAKERRKLHSKGIFTVTQLSYTFRPRRRPKRLRDKREKYHHSLKALAIRENKIHIVGSPELKIEGTPVYLDVEGLPDRDFYYLIGLRIGNGDSAVQHSLWADTVEDEGEIWREFLSILEGVDKPVLVHYGSYETIFLKCMNQRYGSPLKDPAEGNATRSTVNLPSVIFAHIYFPTFSNGLKEVAGWFGFNWSEKDASGTRSVHWRHVWEVSADPKSKMNLITYNSEDCLALQEVAMLVGRICSGAELADTTPGVSHEVVSADAVPQFGAMWRPFSSPISAFETINGASKWNYQRDRVYVRTDNNLRVSFARRVVLQRRAVRPNRDVICQDARTCPRCRRSASFVYAGPRLLYDLRYSAYGVRRWVVDYHFRVFRCPYCRSSFGKPGEFWRRTRFGYGVVVMVVYCVVYLRMVQKAIQESLNAFFGLGIRTADVNRLKASAAGFYEETRRQILARLVAGPLLHADETRIVLKGKVSYVWVFASLHEVAFFYAETREGNLLRELLAEFRGVLVSDFYAAYDALPCQQQKCLIHLMRDLNDTVLDHPYDEKVKRIATGFADVLSAIVETIDRRGLKRRFLSKHRQQVHRFYRSLEETVCETEAALKCKEKFLKNRDKLFTFLDHDGVPWNNNNAEYAIKAFAKIRRGIVGLSTPKGIEEYLVLLSVCQTCKYMGVDFLDFLRSGEKDIHAFAESRRRCRRRSYTSELKAPRAGAQAGE
jgi:predicted RecB family nuclease